MMLKDWLPNCTVGKPGVCPNSIQRPHPRPNYTVRAPIRVGRTSRKARTILGWVKQGGIGQRESGISTVL